MISDDRSLSDTPSLSYATQEPQLEKLARPRPWVTLEGRLPVHCGVLLSYKCQMASWHAAAHLILELWKQVDLREFENSLVQIVSFSKQTNKPQMAFEAILLKAKGDHTSAYLGYQ